ncbi:MAG TPA: flavodoxin domain-containing protein [Candidatus Omnitrophota bacterium]|nr:flavodoxin domain-containing protein [Candidatus Omnitrophota bacterium]HPD84860.1 flavodoxin domain-containing protein [Candidatus Omnitrophota bacterium]HRZ03718.1 flavodoxin domain-containing protein [Candidatus Omnitrophota bacterium]
MSAVKILSNIYWVGAIDWNMRHFHGHTYTTKRGTTYNSYLIVDDKITLVDAVHASFAKELIENIRQVVDPGKIDYIVANHVETDHSGAYPELLKLCPKAKMFGTQKCKEGLQKHYYGNWDFQVVKTGDKINLGKRTLQFIEAAMIHWPDSMFTYCPEEQLLMPNDAFGQHYATSERFDDETDPAVLMEEDAKYYANILWPLSSVIARKLEEIKTSGLPIKMIAPSHGIIWRRDIKKAIDAYTGWSQNKTKPKVVIAYETMWGATEKMAYKMSQGLTDAGLEVKLYDVAVTDRTEIITQMLDAKGYLFGSSTHDNDMLTIIGGFLAFLKGLKPRNRVACAFGSYGWAGGAVKAIEEIVKEAGITLAQPGLSVQYVPDENELKRCYEYGKEFAKIVKAG